MKELNAQFKLLELRRSLGYTQLKLGLLVAREIKKHFSKPYAQKKISQWESGITRPNEEESNALAHLFGLGRPEIEQFFSKAAPLSAADMLEDLSISAKPSLVIACYSSKPRATLVQDVRKALANALTANVSFAMFFPHPLAIDPSLAASFDDDLLKYYCDTWNQVLAHYKDLRSDLIPAKRKNIILYAPKPPLRGANILVPPSNIRYTLVTQTVGQADFQSTLYSWVETESVDGLYRVGTFSLQKAASQIPAWQGYFGKVISHWKATYRLISGDKYWKSVKV
jgi:transcriptional regulator with XRE-family HTH domain